MCGLTHIESSIQMEKYAGTTCSCGFTCTLVVEQHLEETEND